MVQRIKELCKEKGITIAELERKCGIGNGIIARWKTSKPSYERLLAVASALETSVEYLQTGEGQKEAAKPEAEAISLEKQALYDAIDKMSRAELILLLERAEKIINSR